MLSHWELELRQMLLWVTLYLSYNVDLEYLFIDLLFCRAELQNSNIFLAEGSWWR